MSAGLLAATVVSVVIFGKSGVGELTAQETPPVRIVHHIATPTDAEFEAALNEDNTRADSNGIVWRPIKQEVGRVLRYLPAPTQSPSMSLAEREYERRRGEVAYIEQLDRIVDPPDGIGVLAFTRGDGMIHAEPCPPAMNQPNCIVSPSFLFFREEHRDPPAGNRLR